MLKDLRDSYSLITKNAKIFLLSISLGLSFISMVISTLILIKSPILYNLSQTTSNILVNLNECLTAIGFGGLVISFFIFLTLIITISSITLNILDGGTPNFRHHISTALQRFFIVGIWSLIFFFINLIFFKISLNINKASLFITIISAVYILCFLITVHRSFIVSSLQTAYSHSIFIFSQKIIEILALLLTINVLTYYLGIIGMHPFLSSLSYFSKISMDIANLLFLSAITIFISLYFFIIILLPAFLIIITTFWIRQYHHGEKKDV